MIDVIEALDQEVVGLVVVDIQACARLQKSARNFALVGNLLVAEEIGRFLAFAAHIEKGSRRGGPSEAVYTRTARTRNTIGVLVSPSESSFLHYDDLYRDFDSPLMQQLRRDAYGEDIGQHSWVTADELKPDVARLNLGPASRLLDLGCGAGGPLAFVAGLARCHGSGLDCSAQAIAAGQDRATKLGLTGQLTFRQANLDEPLPFPIASFEAAMSLDVVLHQRLLKAPT